MRREMGDKEEKYGEIILISKMNLCRKMSRKEREILINNFHKKEKYEREIWRNNSHK